MMQKYSHGFTLVELAIALMVIGLLIGGVLKGQELIANARMTSLVRQLNDYDAATLIFRNTYNALPGDIKRPNRIPNCTEEPCSIAGNGDGKVLITATERPNYWFHLEKAGLISGCNWEGTHVTASPEHAFGGYTSIKWQSGLVGSDKNYYYISDGSTVGQTRSSLQLASALDYKMDDGKPMTGLVNVIATTSNDSQDGVCYDGATNTYLDDPAAVCVLWIEAKSAR